MTRRGRRRATRRPDGLFVGTRTFDFFQSSFATPNTLAVYRHAEDRIWKSPIYRANRHPKRSDGFRAKARCFSTVFVLYVDYAGNLRATSWFRFRRRVISKPVRTLLEYYDVYEKVNVVRGQRTRVLFFRVSHRFCRPIFTTFGATNKLSVVIEVIFVFVCF